MSRWRAAPIVKIVVQDAFVPEPAQRAPGFVHPPPVAFGHVIAIAFAIARPAIFALSRFVGRTFQVSASDGSRLILACMAYVDLNPVRARIADGLDDSDFTSVYDRVHAQRAKARLKELGEVSNPTVEQDRSIKREIARKSGADWLFDFADPSSPFEGVEWESYLSLVEWTGQTIRSGKPGSLPVNLKPVLDRFGLDAAEWAGKVASYGSLFHRVAGQVEQLLDYARRRGQSWFCGQSGSARLYAN